MAEITPEIRNTVRAVIMRGDNLLLLQKEGESGNRYFALPGGGQNSGESLFQALQRECEEEIAVNVRIRRLLVVAEWLKMKDRLSPVQKHHVDFIFSCEVPADYQPRMGDKPDKRQKAVVWLKTETLSPQNMSPSYLANVIKQQKWGETPYFMDLINGCKNS